MCLFCLLAIQWVELTYVYGQSIVFLAMKGIDFRVLPGSSIKSSYHITILVYVLVWLTSLWEIMFGLVLITSDTKDENGIRIVLVNSSWICFQIHFEVSELETTVEINSREGSGGRAPTVIHWHQTYNIFLYAGNIISRKIVDRNVVLWVPSTVTDAEYPLVFTLYLPAFGLTHRLHSRAAYLDLNDDAKGKDT